MWCPCQYLCREAESQPVANAFHVADVKSVHPTATGQMTHVTLTSTAAGRDGEPMVLDYPPGTVLRKIV